MRIKLNLADIQMAMEMHDASPDGQAEQQRIRDTIAALPSATFEVKGYWVCATGCGTCQSCREVSE